MGRRVISAALTALGAACALAGPASAGTVTVDQSAGPYRTITDALHAALPGDTIDIHQGNYDEQLWVDKDDITLRGAPGTIVSSTARFVVSLMGARDTLEGLFVAGGPGGVRIEGDGVTLRDAKVWADDDVVVINGAVSTLIDHTMMRATALAGTALKAANTHAAPAAQLTRAATSVILGGRQGTGIDVQTGFVGDTSVVGPATLDLLFTTVTGAPTAFTSAANALGGAVSGTAVNSILLGATNGLTARNSETGSPDVAIFRDPGALDFHPRADAPVLGGQLQGPLSFALPEPLTDLDHRLLAGTPNLVPALGAYAFVDTPPTAALTASTDSAGQHVPVAFDASRSGDPDPGDHIRSYTWTFGDGTPPIATSTPHIQHAFADVGTATASVEVADLAGLAATSRTVRVAITDAVAPKVSITAPREKARLHRYRTITIKAKAKRGKHGKRKATKKKRVVNILRFGGRAADAGGVARVEVVLRQTAPKTPKGLCTYLDAARLRAAARPCADPPVIRAALKGGAWSWSTPSRLAVPAGSWELTVRATDPAGNLATSVLHFTVT